MKEGDHSLENAVEYNLKACDEVGACVVFWCGGVGAGVWDGGVML